MTQVWMIRNSGTDIHLFNRFEHLEPSLRISYSSCKNVTIQQVSRGARDASWRVTGERETGWFDETVSFTCYPVWTEPCHL